MSGEIKPPKYIVTCDQCGVRKEAMDELTYTHRPFKGADQGWSRLKYALREREHKYSVEHSAFAWEEAFLDFCSWMCVRNFADAKSAGEWRIDGE